MLYPARWKKITVDHSKVLKNRLYRLFRFLWATRYSMYNVKLPISTLKERWCCSGVIGINREIEPMRTLSCITGWITVIIVLPYFGKRKQVTYHLNLIYWWFIFYLVCSSFRLLYRVSQKERNTYDHSFHRNRGLNQTNECIKATI